MGQFVVSARKYRPASFETLVGQDNIAKTLKNSITSGQLAHAYLFCGPRGVGKTSTARIFAKTINCSNPTTDMEPCGECESCRSFAEGRSYCIRELDAASNNSVDDIRSLTDQVRIPPQIGKYSVYIIDEVHMLSQAAFNAFLKTLEEPPGHAIFILATTEKHKILPTILSRCQTYDFNRISIEDMVSNLKMIATKEDINISDDALHIIAQKADGAMRDALTLFDQSVAFCGDNITYQMVIDNLNVLDYEYYFRIVEHFIAGEYPQALMLFDEILSKGFNALHFIGGLSTHFRDLIVCKNSSSRSLAHLAPSVSQRYEECGVKCSMKFLYEALSITTNCEAGYRTSGNPRLLIEFAIIKLSQLLVPFEVEDNQQPQVQSKPEQQQQVATPQPVKITTPSIKDLLKRESSVEKNLVEKSEAVDIRQTITDDMVVKAWDDVVASVDKKPRLRTLLQQYSPKYDESSHSVIQMVNNEAQKSWIMSTCFVNLEALLRKSLGDTTIKLVFDVVPQSEVENVVKPYMPIEKANAMREKSAELRAFEKEFELEVS